MEQTELQARLETIRSRMAQASAGRYPLPKVLAVTKTHPAEEILPLRDVGLTAIGENRVQEIREKLPALKDFFQIHLIGQLQSNKVKYIIEDVCLIHSLDRLSLAMEIDRQAQKHGRVMPVLVQVSPVGEPQKCGIDEDDLLPFIRRCAEKPGLRVRGLMAIMPITADPEAVRPYFRRMRGWFERLRDMDIDNTSMDILSMGMSSDCIVAAQEGATMVRLGRNLFGERTYK